MRVCLAVLLLLVAPAVAGAATAGVEDGRLHYVAGPAEANRVVLEVEGGQITLTDLGAEIAAKEGCRVVDLQRVTCTAASVWAELGDADDSIESPPEADTFDGGEGVDTLNYEARSEDLLIDLADPELDGEDTTTGFENIAGGTGQDKLYGTGADNVIDAGAGSGGAADLLAGRGGNDTLLAGPRGSGLDGGGGDDVLVGGTGADRFACGAGDEDLVESVTVRVDYVTAGCEELHNRRLVLAPIARVVSADELRYAIECALACTGTLRLLSGRRLVGRGEFGGTGDLAVDVALNRRGRVLLRAGRTPVADAYLRAAGAPDTAWSARFPSR